MGSLVGAVVIVSLIAVMLLPSLVSRSSPIAESPLVVDLPTLPTLSWSAEEGQRCGADMDEDHMIMFQTYRVWSLNLRTGRTAWSAMLPTLISDVTCLPGANLIAVTENAATDAAFGITLLDGTTGETVDVLPSTATTQVIPLGKNVGLVGPDNVLTMVTRAHLDSPKWTHALPGRAGAGDWIYTYPLSDDTVQFFVDDADAEFGYKTTVLSVHDGNTPAWFTPSDNPNSSYLFHDDIILWVGVTEDLQQVTAMNRRGKELWTRSDLAYPSVGGDRLFLSMRSETEGSSRVFEADARTGKPVNGNAYEGDFYSVEQTRVGGVVAREMNAITFLDDELQPQKRIDGGGEINFVLDGTNQVFLCVDTDPSVTTDRMRISAISPDDHSVLWTLDLEENQSVDQVGKYLIVTDHSTGTIHGLWSSSD